LAAWRIRWTSAFAIWFFIGPLVVVAEILKT
jgi:hypothetical protein